MMFHIRVGNEYNQVRICQRNRRGLHRPKTKHKHTVHMRRWQSEEKKAKQNRILWDSKDQSCKQTNAISVLICWVELTLLQNPISKSQMHVSENLSLIAYLQSISKAWPSLPRTDTNWSMMPQGTPAWVCSACWHATALDMLSLSSAKISYKCKDTYVKTCF